MSILCTIIISGCGPEIARFDPPGARIGDTVTITGARFETDMAKDTVWFGRTRAQIASVPTSERIVTTVPGGATTGILRVATPKGQDSSDNNFVVISPRKWTFLVYLDADNNLETDGILDFLEMASIGSSPAVNIVVQMDRTPGYTPMYGNWDDTRRFLIKKNDTPESAPLEHLGEMNMGDPAVLRDFVTWGVTQFPAERYILVIWNHGGGWKVRQDQLAAMRTPGGRGAAADVIFKEVAYDDTDHDVLYMREVQTALTMSRDDLRRQSTFVKLDVIGFDACLMGMVEVGYALRDCANVLVASEEIEPGTGWPYDAILRGLVNDPSMAPDSVGSHIVTEYGKSYPSTTDSLTLSAIDLAQIVPLAVAIDIFTDAAQSEWDSLRISRRHTRQYHPSGYDNFWGTDLTGFAEEVARTAATPQLRGAATALALIAGRCVISETHAPQARGSHGLAIYFPPTKGAFEGDPDHTHYLQENEIMAVDFVKQHAWDEWLLTFYAQTDGLP